MIDALLAKFTTVVNTIPFSAATWFVLSVLSFFVWLFAKASRDPKSPVSWEHLILDTETNRANPYKLGYLVGIIVSTWIMIAFADSNRLTFDLLGVYLTFLVGGVGVNVLAKKAVAKVVDDVSDPKK